MSQEMTLWTPWLHLGDLTTREDCGIVSLRADAFYDCMRRWWNLFDLAQVYARPWAGRVVLVVPCGALLGVNPCHARDTDVNLQDLGVPHLLHALHAVSGG